MLLAGTWELPWVESSAGDAAAALGSRYGGRFALGAELGRVRHAITTRRIVASVRRGIVARRDDELAEVPERIPMGREAAWVHRAEVATLPTSSLVRKALALAP